MVPIVELCPERVSSESLTSSELLNEKHKKYMKNLFIFNSQQIAKKMLKNVDNNNSTKNISQSSLPPTIYNSRFRKLSYRYAYLNNAATIRSRSLDFSGDNGSNAVDSCPPAELDFTNVHKTTISLQSLDLAHVEVLSHKKHKITSRQINVHKKGLDTLDRKMIKPQMLCCEQNESCCYKSQCLGDICESRDNSDCSLAVVDNSCLKSSSFNQNAKCSSPSNPSHDILCEDQFKYNNNIIDKPLGDDKTLLEDPYNTKLPEESNLDLSHLSKDTSHPSTINELENKSVASSNAPNTLRPIAESKSSYPVENMNSDFVTVSKRNNLSTPVPRLSCERRTQSVSLCMGLTRLSPPEPGPSRRHRHSISGQMSYLRMTGYGLMIQHQRRGGGSTNSLFSTAVISGSSSAPNLRDMIPNTAAVAAAIEGCGGVPPIRPLETLHNALSLRQIDAFLGKMSRTMAPKNSTHTTQSCQSPNNSMGWSGPPSFVSSSGPSSPNGLTDFIRGGIANSDSSDFSTMSNDGSVKMGSGSSINRDDRESDIDIEECYGGHRDSLEIMELINWSQQQLITDDNIDRMHFSPINPVTHADSGDVTPVSVRSEIDRNDFENITCVEDDDEEKTLTAFTKEEMNRPRLAEIMWSQDGSDPLIKSSAFASESNIQPQKVAYGRFQCVGALPDSVTNKDFEPCAMESTGHRSTLMEQGACEPIFEMETDCDVVVNETAAAQTNDQPHHNLHRLCKRRFTSSDMSSKEVKPPPPENGGGSDSPIVTIASSSKGVNSVSIGFVIPDSN